MGIVYIMRERQEGCILNFVRKISERISGETILGEGLTEH
jgi:hypothetical protein